MMRLENVNKNFDEKQVFNRFSIEFEDGKITAVMGESGVGKTTLLKILAGFTNFDGKVQNLPEKVSFVFQEDRLLPFKTVRENLEFALGKGDYEDALESVGLAGYGNKYPSELSGGMKRRVAILRAFLYKSDVLLMDEPFSSLDVAVKYKLMNLFKEMHRTDPRSVIMVTHNIDEALYLADRIVVIGKGGKILFDKDCVGDCLREEIIDVFMNGRNK